MYIPQASPFSHAWTLLARLCECCDIHVVYATVWHSNLSATNYMYMYMYAFVHVRYSYIMASGVHL